MAARPQAAPRRRTAKAAATASRADYALSSSTLPSQSSSSAEAASCPPMAAAAAATDLAMASDAAAAPECRHVRAFAAAGGFDHLPALIGVIFGSPRTAAKMRAPYCFACKLSGSRLHACLECVYVGCWEGQHIQDHACTRRHRLALELRGLHVLCFDCDDYVYDDAVELSFRKHVALDKMTPRETDSYNLIVSQDDASPRLLAQRSIGFWHYSLRRDRHGFAGLRGMLNLGNTCFMNVVLQTLVHNPLIRDFFLKDGHNRYQCSSHGDALCLGCDMDLIFEKAFHGETDPYAPHQFLCAMWSHASHLAGYEQQDAHEFLISLLDALHLRCGGTTSADCACVIHRTFGGTFRSVVTCLSCLSTYTAYDPLLEIAVDLTALHPSSLQPQTLIDCFDRFTQPERLADKFFCRQCQSHQSSTKQLSVHTLPTVLTIHLKRFKHLGHSAAQSTKLDAYIAFPIAHLDLSAYVSEPSVAKSEIQLGVFVYNLFAVVEHKGSSESGHYIAYIRRNQQWFKCDDAKITMKSEREVLASQAYMLFYLKSSCKSS